MWRLLLLLPTAAMADSLVANRTIRAMAVLAPEDVTLVEAAIPGALEDPLTAIGMEARIAIYPGRAIRAQDIGPPALIDRNQIVPLIYRAGAVSILTEGRALARGGTGDVIRVMNLASRTTVTGQIGPDGVVRVGPQS
ncbi:MAG: flagellar basal body P-ring formation chaperone FlgA [Pseudomonadota bacterium]